MPAPHPRSTQKHHRPPLSGPRVPSGPCCHLVLSPPPTQLELPPSIDHRSSPHASPPRCPVHSLPGVKACRLVHTQGSPEGPEGGPGRPRVGGRRRTPERVSQPKAIGCGAVGGPGVEGFFKKEESRG